MEKNIEKYVFVKQNFLDNEFCQNTIKKLNQLNVWKKHGWTSYNYNQEQELVSTSPSEENEPEAIQIEELKALPKLSFNFHSEGSSSTQFIYEEVIDINDILMSKITELIQEYIDNLKFEWFKNINGITKLKFIKYSSNQKMEEHCDHIHTMFNGKRKGIPTLSIIGLLNDDYEGGNLVMFGDKKIETKQGDLIIFPSLFLFPHKIEPVTKSIRYSYVSWVW